MTSPLRSRRGQRRRHRTRGQALVEFALVIPVFLLVLCGILDFGFLLYGRMTVINSAREGARAGITAPDTTTIPQYVQQAAEAAANGIAPGDLTITTVCVPNTGSCDFSSVPPAATAPGTGDSIKVTVAYTYHTFFPFLFGASIPLSSTVQMAVE